MAGIITITDDRTWAASNWVYWCLMDQVLAAVADQPAVADVVEQCKWMHGLDIQEMQREKGEMAALVFSALKNAAQACSDGGVTAKVDGRVLEEESQRQFREATGELVAILSSPPDATNTS